jgi:dsDNA-specific endonuclease/ATPase MutS2
VQALGGGSPELRPLAAARDGGPAALTDEEPDEPVVVPLEDALDLHAFSPRDVASVVGEYLTAAASHGFRDVRLVHGRGIGAQRAIVRGVLSRHPLVTSFADAPPEAGGWGATIVRLGRPEPPCN